MTTTDYTRQREDDHNIITTGETKKSSPKLISQVSENCIYAIDYHYHSSKAELLIALHNQIP